MKRASFTVLRRGAGLKSLASSIRLLCASLRASLQLRKCQVLGVLRANSILLVQSEALTAAESLASMNEEFIAKMEANSLTIGAHSMKAAVDKTAYRLKLKAMLDLSRS
jgi:hypothetical protein